MINKVEQKEVITDLEARKKYRDKYIGYISVEQNMMDPENEKIVVLFLADDLAESYEIPSEDENGHIISKMAGLGVGGTEIGGICFDE